MRTTEILTKEAVSTTYFKRNKGKSKYTVWDKKEAKNCSTIRCCNAFLKTSFYPITQKELYNPLSHDLEYNYFNQNNYEYLRDSALQYAKLLNRELTYTQTSDIGMNIANLYKSFQAILGDIGLNIEIDGKGLVFIIYKKHDWGDILLWLSVKFIELLDRELQNIAITFVREFSKSNGILSLFATTLYENVRSYLEESLDDQGYSDDELKEYKDLLQSYETGEINMLFSRVMNAKPCKVLPEMIASCRPRQEREKKLIQLFEEGLQFIGTDLPSIKQYEYDPESELDDEICPIGFDDTILLVYDEDDWLSENMIEHLNYQLQDSYTINPHSVMQLCPETDKLLLLNDYPERFKNWFNKFVSFIEEQYE